MVVQIVAILSFLLTSGVIDEPKTQKAFSSFLVSGDRAYVKMRDIYLGVYGVGTKWSSDSKSLLVESLSDKQSVRELRRTLIRNGEIREGVGVLIRYNVETGLREVLYRVTDGEGIEERIFVGAGSDVLFSVFGIDASGKLKRRLYFAPVGEKARPVGEELDIRSSPAIISATSSARALVAVTTQDKKLQVYLITPDSSKPLEIPGDWQSAAFTTNTKQGMARIAVGKVDEKEGGTGTIYDIDYVTGKVSEVTPATAYYELPVVPPPLFRTDIYTTARSGRKPERDTNQKTPVVIADDSLTAVYDVDLLDDAEMPHRLSVARGFEGYPERSPDGLKLAFQTPHGFFIAELVALSPEATRKK